MPSPLAEALLPWYRNHARVLPWRNHPDPYAVWVSEIMLQQTQIETAIPYYERWMQRFPTIAELASASQQTVLAMWEGLGYYQRARNLHRASQIVLEEYDGSLPADLRALRRLPGIGPYTAGAIASMAFGLDEPALDGNIRRVLARVFNVTEPAGSTLSERCLWQLAGSNLPPGEAGDYNQALMDLGSSLCTPRSPDCTDCPLSSMCQAYNLGVQDERPVRKIRQPIPHHTVTAAVIEHQGNVLIAQRPLDGLLGGMWEFPGGKLEQGEELASCLKREICEEIGVDIQILGEFGVYQHAYTHYKVTLHAFYCNMVGGSRPEPVQVAEIRWVEPVELGNYPMGKIDRQIASRVLQVSRC